MTPIGHANVSGKNVPVRGNKGKRPRVKNEGYEEVEGKCKDDL